MGGTTLLVLNVLDTPVIRRGLFYKYVGEPEERDVRKFLEEGFVQAVVTMNLSGQDMSRRVKAGYIRRYRNCGQDRVALYGK
ncbi:hypothetical protein J6590_023585 [Homalodisca vitripennis]|nr:hypothetical protein J6590_023585 [Homalodisca vitripennis]